MRKAQLIVLCAMMLILAGCALNEKDSGEKEPLAIVYAASDFQAYAEGKDGVTEDDISSGQNVMTKIINKMQADGYKNVDGALICGDYSKTQDAYAVGDAAINNAGVVAVREVLYKQWNLDYEDIIFVQGNHDPSDTIELDLGGENDTDYYGVYVMHEDMFPWRQEKNDVDGETVQATANALDIYLNEKVEQKFSRPIFICGHVPLHFSYRTWNDQENIYAKYIFDVLNRYGKYLNIVFLFGHDHSGSFDDYIGGGAVYLPEGSTILIPDEGSDCSYTEYMLNFTYLNTGYLGYYNGKCNTELSSTVFEIYDDELVISRYDKKGKTKLKDDSVWSEKDSKWFLNDYVNDDSYSSPQAIDLKGFDVSIDWGDVSDGMISIGESTNVFLKGEYGKEYFVEWESSNETVATIEGTGSKAILSGIGTGDAILKATITKTWNSDDETNKSEILFLIEVSQKIPGECVELFETGTYSYFKKVSEIEYGKTYMLVDMEENASIIGPHMALQYSGKLDVQDEGDTENSVEQEVNAAKVRTFQLPIGNQTETLVLADEMGMNPDCWWIFEKNERDRTVIKSYQSDHRAFAYLSVSEGDSNYNMTDSDHDRIRMVEVADGGSAGYCWTYEEDLGLRCKEKTDGFRYVLYYSQEQNDFSAYRYQHNGKTISNSGSSASKINDSEELIGRPLKNEEVNSQVYLFELQNIYLEQAVKAQLDDLVGYVNSEAPNGTQTGDRIILSNGSMEIAVPVTLDMLTDSSGNKLDSNKPGTYTDLTVNYGGNIVAVDYTLIVRDTVTRVKNHGACETLDSLYRLTEKIVPGKQYILVDGKKEGVANAIGISEDLESISEYNVEILAVNVDGEEVLCVEVGDNRSKNPLIWTATQRIFSSGIDPEQEYYDVYNRNWTFLKNRLTEQLICVTGYEEECLFIPEDTERLNADHLWVYERVTDLEQISVMKYDGYLVTDAIHADGTITREVETMSK